MGYTYRNSTHFIENTVSCIIINLAHKSKTNTALISVTFHINLIRIYCVDYVCRNRKLAKPKFLLNIKKKSVNKYKE